jgi:RNA polymerase sigma factor (sigma-70 family)
MKRSQNRLAALNQFEAAEQQQEQDKHSDAVRQALWNLRAAEREPIVLRYYNGFSYEQISAVLGISTQAVHGRLTRAKRKIEKILKRNGFPGGDYESA